MLFTLLLLVRAVGRTVPASAAVPAKANMEEVAVAVAVAVEL
jgi:hypothetical protein